MKNLKVNRKRKRAELELRSDFYPEHVLRKAARDFGKVFRTDIEKDGEKFVITLKTKSEGIEIEKGAWEFLNYLLAEVKNDTVKV